MPRGDGTGPMGMGPLTGRGAGFCAGAGKPGYAHPGPPRFFGGGSGRGRGVFGDGGRGRRNRFYATGLPGRMRFSGYGLPSWETVDSEMEKQTLKGRADALQGELDLIKQRLSDLERSTSP